MSKIERIKLSLSQRFVYESHRREALEIEQRAIEIICSELKEVPVGAKVFFDNGYLCFELLDSGSDGADVEERQSGEQRDAGVGEAGNS